MISQFAAASNLVSAIMPTSKSRREFIPGAIRCYQSQTYGKKQLVVVDDTNPAEPGIDDLIPRDDPSILYIRLPRKFTIGEKRNIGCDQSAGEFAVHWDDDDWSAPDRIDRQVHFLKTFGASVTGFNSILFWDVQAGKGWRYTGTRRYAVGTTLCYRLAYWRGHPFEARQVGEDNAFVFRAQRDDCITPTEGDRLVVARIHAGTTSPKRTELSNNWRPAPAEEFPAGFRETCRM